jgi:hypothetical protein
MSVLRTAHSLWSRINCAHYDTTELNITSGVLDIFAAVLAILALCNEWVAIDDEGGYSLTYTKNGNAAEENVTDFRFVNNPFTSENPCAFIAECAGIGGAHFWLPARYGKFVGQQGREHYTYHYGRLCLIDCITPTIANFFYLIIAFCFVVAVTSSFAAAMHLLVPPVDFLVWLRRNNVLEVCSMIMIPVACLCGLLVEYEVESMRPRSNVSLGPGLFFALISGLSSVFASVMALRQKNRIQRLRRIDNQRLMCTRTLRSWRDVSSRREDRLPIIDFERYLMGIRDATNSGQSEYHRLENPILVTSAP